MIAIAIASHSAEHLRGPPGQIRKPGKGAHADGWQAIVRTWRTGPALLVISLCAGLLIQPLAHFGYDLLPFSAFLLTLGSFLTAGLAPSEARIRLPLMALVIAWVGLALPLAAAALLSFLPLDPALRAGVLLSLLAPPVGSAAAIAGMLGLRTRLALLVSIALTLLAPISIPCFATVLGLGIEFDMGALAIRLFSIIGAAGLVAFLAIRFHRRSDARSARPTRCHRGRRYPDSSSSDWQPPRAYGPTGSAIRYVSMSCSPRRSSPTLDCACSQFLTFARMGLRDRWNDRPRERKP